MTPPSLSVRLFDCDVCHLRAGQLGDSRLSDAVARSGALVILDREADA